MLDKKHSKGANYERTNGGEFRKNMILDNWEEEDLKETNSKDLAEYISEVSNSNTTVKVSLLTSDGTHSISSKYLNMRYDKETNELILFNYV